MLYRQLPIREVGVPPPYAASWRHGKLASSFCTRRVDGTLPGAKDKTMFAPSVFEKNIWNWCPSFLGKHLCPLGVCPWTWHSGSSLPPRWMGFVDFGFSKCMGRHPQGSWGRGYHHFLSSRMICSASCPLILYQCGKLLDFRPSGSVPKKFLPAQFSRSKKKVWRRISENKKSKGKK